MVSDHVQQPELRPTFLGHPRGLIVLFFTEMWERFSYYGMKAILIFYLGWHFLYESSISIAVLGGYIAMVYLSPLIGGYLADKYIGFRKAVIFGGTLLVVGHGLMGFHGAPASEHFEAGGQTYELTRKAYDDNKVRTLMVEGQARRVEADGLRQLDDTSWQLTYADAQGGQVSMTGRVVRERSLVHEQILYLALAFIVIGVGFLKPNISTCVGALYDAGDTRRDPGFTLYYMGINLGAFLASSLVPFIALLYGWSAGFGAAALGMLAGLVIFVLFQGELEGRADPPANVDQATPILGFLTFPLLSYLCGIVLVLVAFVMLQSIHVVEPLMYVVFCVVSSMLLVFMFRSLEAQERDRMVALFILIIASILFWVLFDQAASSLNLFAAEHVDTKIAGYAFPAAVLQSINPLYILIFASPVALLWVYLARYGREPNIFVKFALALIQIGAGYLVLNIGIALAGNGNDVAKVSIVFILLLYLLHTTGELFLSPTGLSAVTKLSVPRLVSFMMGYWFFAVSLANILGIVIAKATQVPEGAGAAASLAAYNTVYLMLGLSAVSLGVIVWAGAGYLNRLTHGVK